MTIRPLSSEQRPLGSTTDQPPTAPKIIARLRTDDRRQRWIRWAIVFWLAAIAGLLTTTAEGQETYKSFPMKPPAMAVESNAKKMVSAVKSYAGGGAKNAYIDPYFKRYIPAVLTNQDYLPLVSGAMDDYHDILDRAERSGKNLRQIQTVTYQVMKFIAEGNYSPVARINAITVLSRLDSRPADTYAKKPPVPMAVVLPILIELYQSNENNDGVRAAALHGIHRHVNFGFAGYSAAAKNRLTAMMNELLDSPPPSGRSPEAHAYLQKFAVDILEKLRDKGDTALGEKLISISTEWKQPSLIALHSAASIGPIGGELKGKIADPAKVLESWSRRALIVLEAELERLKSLDRAESAAGQPPSPDSNSTGDGRANPGGGARPRTGGRMDSALSNAIGGSALPRSNSPTADDDDDSGLRIGGALDGVIGGGRRSGRGRREPRRAEKTVPGQNQPPQVVGARRQLNHALQQLQMGVTGSPTIGMPSRTTGGLLASVADDAKPSIEQWVDEIKSLVDEINSEYLETRDAYIKMLETQVDVLRERVGEPPIERPEAQPGDDDLPADQPENADAPAAAEAADPSVR